MRAQSSKRSICSSPNLVRSDLIEAWSSNAPTCLLVRSGCLAYQGASEQDVRSVRKSCTSKKSDITQSPNPRVTEVDLSHVPRDSRRLKRPLKASHACSNLNRPKLHHPQLPDDHTLTCVPRSTTSRETLPFYPLSRRLALTAEL